MLTHLNLWTTSVNYEECYSMTVYHMHMRLCYISFSHHPKEITKLFLYTLHPLCLHYFFNCLCTFLYMFFTSHALLYVLSQSWQVFSSWSTFHLYCFSKPAKNIKLSQLSIIINMSQIAFCLTYKAWTFPYILQKLSYPHHRWN